MAFFPVLYLCTSLLAFDDDTAGLVREAYGGFHFIHVLAHCHNYGKKTIQTFEG